MNSIVGTAGDNGIDGRGGADVLTGNGGIDTFTSTQVGPTATPSWTSTAWPRARAIN